MSLYSTSSALSRLEVLKSSVHQACLSQGKRNPSPRRGLSPTINRPETEAYTMHLSEFLQTAAARIQAKHSKGEDLALKLNILDLCSGSGCISLLLYETLRKHYRKIQINGWDISKEAIKNAEHNIYHNVDRFTLSSDVNNHVKFHQGDIFNPLQSELSKHIAQADIIIANPPYISEQQFVTETEESVRRYEPKLALVPDVAMAETWLKESKELSPSTKFEDVFYHRMIPYWADNARCKLMVMEVGDDEQAIRVVTALLSMYSSSLMFPYGVQIWRDWPDHQDPDNDEKSIGVEGLKVNVIGAGKMRAVVFVAGDITAMKESAMDTVMVGNLADMGQVLSRSAPAPSGGGLLELLFGFH